MNILSLPGFIKASWANHCTLKGSSICPFGELLRKSIIVHLVSSLEEQASFSGMNCRTDRNCCALPKTVPKPIKNLLFWLCDCVTGNQPGIQLPQHRWASQCNCKCQCVFFSNMLDSFPYLTTHSSLLELLHSALNDVLLRIALATPHTSSL